MILDVQGESIIVGEAFQFNIGRSYHISSAPVSEKEIMVLFSDANNSNAATATLLKINGNKVGGDFIASSTQAIALQSGTAGQTIPVCYSGIVKAPFVSQGDVISSSGVTGVGILDGVLQVYAKDAPGKVVTGSYVGTGTYGQSNPNTLTFSKTPKMFGIYATNTLSGGNVALAENILQQTVVPWIVGKTIDTVLADAKTTKMTFTNNTVSWYSSSAGSNAGSQLNSQGWTYYYFAVY